MAGWPKSFFIGPAGPGSTPTGPPFIGGYQPQQPPIQPFNNNINRFAVPIGNSSQVPTVSYPIYQPQNVHLIQQQQLLALQQQQQQQALVPNPVYSHPLTQQQLLQQMQLAKQQQQQLQANEAANDNGGDDDDDDDDDDEEEDDEGNNSQADVTRSNLEAINAERVNSEKEVAIITFWLERYTHQSKSKRRKNRIPNKLNLKMTNFESRSIEALNNYIEGKSKVKNPQEAVAKLKSMLGESEYQKIVEINRLYSGPDVDKNEIDKTIRRLKKSKGFVSPEQKMLKLLRKQQKKKLKLERMQMYANFVPGAEQQQLTPTSIPCSQVLVPGQNPPPPPPYQLQQQIPLNTVPLPYSREGLFVQQNLGRQVMVPANPNETPVLFPAASSSSISGNVSSSGSSIGGNAYIDLTGDEDEDDIENPEDPLDEKAIRLRKLRLKLLRKENEIIKFWLERRPEPNEKPFPDVFKLRHRESIETEAKAVFKSLFVNVPNHHRPIFSNPPNSRPDLGPYFIKLTFTSANNKTQTIHAYGKTIEQAENEAAILGMKQLLTEIEYSKLVEMVKAMRSDGVNLPRIQNHLTFKWKKRRHRKIPRDEQGPLLPFEVLDSPDILESYDVVTFRKSGCQMRVKSRKRTSSWTPSANPNAYPWYNFQKIEDVSSPVAALGALMSAKLHPIPDYITVKYPSKVKVECIVEGKYFTTEAQTEEEAKSKSAGLALKYLMGHERYAQWCKKDVK